MRMRVNLLRNAPRLMQNLLSRLSECVRCCDAPRRSLHLGREPMPVLVCRSARACLEAACSLSCADPAKYVRRAAELCASLPAPVPGLSAECAAYVASHPSNAFDEGVVQARATVDLWGRPEQSRTLFQSLSTATPPSAVIHVFAGNGRLAFLRRVSTLSVECFAYPARSELLKQEEWRRLYLCRCPELGHASTALHCCRPCHLAWQACARGLCDGGYRDEAAAVYCNLLRSGCDKAQQADLLRRCLQVLLPSTRMLALTLTRTLDAPPIDAEDLDNCA
jgi:hypothetical protein